MKKILVPVITIVMLLAIAVPVWAFSFSFTGDFSAEQQAKAIEINAVSSNRSSSANPSKPGFKITSHSQSEEYIDLDCGGICFYWENADQHGDGYLLVNAGVFDEYASFILTTHEDTLGYWDFVIETPQQNQNPISLDGEDWYLFSIKNQGGNNKIDQVFVDGFKPVSEDPADPVDTEDPEDPEDPSVDDDPVTPKAPKSGV